MDRKFITQTFTIMHHPIMDIKHKFRDAYIYGLGEFLCYAPQSGGNSPFELKNHQPQKDFPQNPFLKVLVVGAINSGKSMLINAIVGFPLNKVSSTVCTRNMAYVFNKPYSEGTLWSPDDNINETIDGEVQQGTILYVANKFDSQLLGDIPICLIDTPGTNNFEHPEYSQITFDAIKGNEYDVLLFVADSNYFQTNDEEVLLRTVAKTKKPIIFVLNKLDTFKRGIDSVERMLNTLEFRINELRCDAFIVPVSAEVAYYAKRNEQGLLSEDEIIEWQQHFKKFTGSQYYDLPSYYGQPSPQNRETVLEKSGIPLLEALLAKHTNIHPINN